MNIKSKNVFLSAPTISTAGPNVILTRLLFFLYNEKPTSITVITDNEKLQVPSFCSKQLIDQRIKFRWLRLACFLFSPKIFIKNISDFDLFISFDYSLNLINKDKSQFLYMHNAVCLMPWNEFNKRWELFRYSFYKVLYPLIAVFFLNRHRDTVIVQQRELNSFFSKKGYKTLIQRPDTLPHPRTFTTTRKKHKQFLKETEYHFFYPTFPRPHKNIEFLLDCLISLRDNNFQFIVPFNGNDGSYSRMIVEKYSHDNRISFVGSMTPSEVYDFYREVEPVILFSSKIESWALPLEEAHKFNLKIVCLDRAYARETLGDYDAVSFLSENTSEWCKELRSILS